ncbi:probable NOT transcription complex subunit VIP2 [Phalaenopsis equestris]|uniref:probable NOT transcription complex subunit VIP2 n=1 Tax=Phalaenopsis equestris TaxID=78828 RepID=UPI0009E2BC00|nr:probable NOT transcription complex subunit VIP2 [Phalaenopsis equestris]
MSGLLNSQLNGSASSFPESTGRPFTNSFSAQSATAQGFHPSGLHNVSGSFNIPNMSASLTSRNVALSGVPSNGVQQAGGSISSGRFASNNLPVALSQISHGSTLGHSGVTNRGGISIVGSPAYSSSLNAVSGSLPGIYSNSIVSSNRNSVPGMSTSPILGNVTSRTANSLSNIANGGNVGRNISTTGAALPALASRGNFGGNIGAGSLNLQGTNRLMGSMLQQAPQMLGMLGNSYPGSGGLLSQNHLQAGNSALTSMAILNDVNSNESSPFDMNDFPQLTGRPNSSGGHQGQLGSLRKQGISSIVQQNQEFSIQNEDFPALPGFKGGSSDFSMDLHQKEQLHENVSMLQSQHFPMGRSVGFNLGGSYPFARQQQQQLASAASTASITYKPGSNQELLLHGSDLFSSSNGTYQSQIQPNGLPSIGFRPSSSPIPASGIGLYDQNIQQYQHVQNQSQQQLQQMSSVTQSYRDQSLKSLQVSQTTTDRFGLLGLLSVIRMNNPDLTSLALGIDLTTLGLNLNSNDNLHKKFGSPWSDEPLKGEPESSVPSCYYAKQPPPLQQRHFSKLQLGTLFYIFYSMPKDEAQIYAAYELYLRGWLYHKEAQLWFTRVPNMEPLVKTLTYERGTYFCFDPNTWETIRKENFVVLYESVERKPTLPAQH